MSHLILPADQRGIKRSFLKGDVRHQSKRSFFQCGGGVVDRGEGRVRVIQQADYLVQQQGLNPGEEVSRKKNGYGGREEGYNAGPNIAGNNINLRRVLERWRA